MEQDLSVLSELTSSQIAAIGRLFASGTIPLPQTSAASAPKGDVEDGELSETVVVAGVGSSNGHKDASQMKPETRMEPTVRHDQAQRRLSDGFYARQEAQLEEFVRIMYTNGYGFDTIKHEVKDVAALRVMYQRLSLPTGANDPAAAPSTSAAPKTVVPAATQTNRADYLARLQAAKNKKTEIPATQAQQATIEDKLKVKKGLDPKKTELLKLKLAALRAEQASKQLQTNTALTGLMNRAGVPAVSSKPLDALSGGHPRVVIDVSDQEPDSELDDSADEGAGVSLQGSRAYKKSITSSSSGTPAAEAQRLQQKMREIEAARARLAELEERARSRPSNTATPIASSLGANLTAAAQPVVLHGQSQFQFQAMPLVTQTADDASSVIDDDEDGYDDIYNAADDPSAHAALEDPAQAEDDYTMDTSESEPEIKSDWRTMYTYEGDKSGQDSSSDSNAETSTGAMSTSSISGSDSSGSSSHGALQDSAPMMDDSQDTEASMDISSEESLDNGTTELSSSSDSDASDL